MASHSVTRHPAETTFPPLPRQSWYSTEWPWRNAGSSWPSWLVMYWNDTPAWRRSSVQVLNGPDVGMWQTLLNKHYAMPPTVLVMPCLWNLPLKLKSKIVTGCVWTVDTLSDATSFCVLICVSTVNEKLPLKSLFYIWDRFQHGWERHFYTFYCGVWNVLSDVCIKICWNFIAKTCIW